MIAAPASAELDFVLRRLAPHERRGTEHDAVRLALQSWCQCAAGDWDERHGEGWQRGTPRDVFWSRQHDIASKLIAECEFGVATPEDGADLFMGWVCWSKAGTLHYVYVKAAYRGFGLAAGMFKASGSELRTYSHRPAKRVRQWLERHGLTYDPYTLMT